MTPCATCGEPAEEDPFELVPEDERDLCLACRLALQEIDRRLWEALLSGGVSAQQLSLLASSGVN